MSDDTLDTTPTDTDAASLDEMQVLDIEELLTGARRVRRTATICLRGDLVAKHDEVTAELARYVTSDGELIEDDDESLGGSVSAEKVQKLSAQLATVREQMQESSRRIALEGMSSEAWATFTKAHAPKGDGDATEYNLRMIAECAVEPALTLEQVRKMNATLSASQMSNLVRSAFAACTRGGIDIPKSRDYSPSPERE